MFRTQIAAILVFSGLITSLAFADGMRIVAPTMIREGTRIPVRIERLRRDGSIMKDIWSRRILVVTSGGAAPAVTNVTEFLNGIAVVSVDSFGTNDLNIEVRDTLSSTTNRIVKDASMSETTVGGTLSGDTTSWSGVVRMTNDVTVPAGHTLRIGPGTLVLVEGVASGTTAPDLLVEGNVESAGTESSPVCFTSASAGLNWGQIRHSSGSRGIYRYTFIHKGGRAEGEGHTGAGPVLRLSGADVRLENCTVSELWADRAIGKGMYARNSELVLDGTIFAQMRMGPEIEGTSLLCTNSYFMEMRGPDDCDGIYLHNSDGKSLRVVDSVFIGGDDDAVDTLASYVVIKNCIFRGWLNEGEDAKAISVFNGRVDVQRCLIADCFSGISAKTQSGNTATVHIDHCTIVTKTNGVAAAWKSNAPGPNIDIHVTNSIIVAGPAIYSDFGTTNVSVGYSMLSTEWGGREVSLANPRFANNEAYDFRLSNRSPAIDFGDPAAEADPDGTRTDPGHVAFQRSLASARLHDGILGLSVMDVPHGRSVITEASTDLTTWTFVGSGTAPGLTYVLDWDIDGNGSVRFFRFRIE